MTLGPSSEGGDDEGEPTTRPLERAQATSKPQSAHGSQRTKARHVASDPTRLGPYQLVCELASGGMATVYLALYRAAEGFEKLCAVKRIHPHLERDRAFSNMFADEAQLAARISHPFVCSVFSFGRTEQSHYIAMEFLRGEPLSMISRRIARSAELGDDPRLPAIAARLVANFAEGLHAAHNLRDDSGALLEVVHRDVTPHNLFVLYDGSVRVTDFGIARARRRLHHTEGQELKGKLSYVAPEQLSEGRVDCRVDIWGLGVSLWELLAGRRLMLGATEAETLWAVTAKPIQPPSAFRATVPDALDRIVMRALERDVTRRYSTARQLSRDLEQFLAALGDPVPAMDVADWMARVCPEGANRIQALIAESANISAATAGDAAEWAPSMRGSSIPHHGSYVMVSVPPVSAASLSPANGRLPTAASPQKPRLILLEQVQNSSRPPPARGPLRVGAFIATAVVVLIAIALLVKASRTIATTAAHPPARGPAANALREPPPPLSATLTQPFAAALPAQRDQAAATVRPNKSVLQAVTKRNPPASMPPKRTDAQPVAMGDVVISSVTGPVDVLERGSLLGPTPGKFHLSVGHHDLELRAPGGADRVIDVDVEESVTTLLTVSSAR